MAEIKLTKTELREQQSKLSQLVKYLPTLQLKKAMLQLQVLEAKQELREAENVFNDAKNEASKFSSLLEDLHCVDANQLAKVVHVAKRVENIAGVEIPFFEGIEFAPCTYSLLDSPPWLDAVVEKLRTLKETQARITIAEEKKHSLENELREVSIRVNLFEKILIPRSTKAIKKIKVFLGDQELAAVSRAKVAKGIVEGNRTNGS